MLPGISYSRYTVAELALPSELSLLISGLESADLAEQAVLLEEIEQRTGLAEDDISAISSVAACSPSRRVRETFRRILAKNQGESALSKQGVEISKDSLREMGNVGEIIARIRAETWEARQWGLERICDLLPATGARGRRAMEEGSFYTLLAFFDESPSRPMAVLLFRTLLRLPLSTEEVKSVFDWNNRIEAEAKPSKKGGRRESPMLTWSFLDKDVSMRRTYATFLGRLEKKYESVAVDAIKTFLLLLDDEDSIVRVKSYRALRQIYRRKSKKGTGSLDSHESQMIRSGMLAGRNARAKKIKKEHAKLRKRQREVRLKVAPNPEVKGGLQIVATVGRKVRRNSEVRVCVGYNGRLSAFKCCFRTSTFNFKHCTGALCCKIERNGETLLERSAPPLPPRAASSSRP